jgi:hypothetical protein
VKPWSTRHLPLCEYFVMHNKHYDAISVFCFKITSTSLILLPIINQNNEPLKTLLLLNFPKPITMPCCLHYAQLIHNPWHWLTIMSTISCWWWFQKTRSQNPHYIGNNRKNHLSCWNKYESCHQYIFAISISCVRNETLIQVLNPNILCVVTCKPLVC